MKMRTSHSDTDTSKVIFSGNDHADFTHWPEVVKAVVRLSKFERIDDFAWSESVLKQKEDSSAWPLSLPDKGLMRYGGLLVLARLVAELPVVSTSITELNLRHCSYLIYCEIHREVSALFVITVRWPLLAVIRDFCHNPILFSGAA